MNPHYMPHAFTLQFLRRRRRTALCFAVLVYCAVLACCALALTGCSPGAGSAGPTPNQGLLRGDSSVSDQGAGNSPITDALFRCITDRGWKVGLTADGAIEASSETIPAEQYDLYVKDTWECNAAVSARFPVDDNQKNLLYAAELVERTCLQRHGYTVDDPPSLQSFLDTYDTRPRSDAATSDLGTLSQTMSEADWIAINRACPQPMPGALQQ